MKIEIQVELAFKTAWWSSCNLAWGYLNIRKVSKWLKGNLIPKLYFYFYVMFVVNFMEKEPPYTKLYDVLSDLTKLQYFEFCVSHVIPANVQIFEFFVSFMEKKPPIKVYGVLDHFSRTSEVAKFWIVKLYLNASDVIHANEYKKHANDGLHVNFWKLLLMSFCFMMK